MITNYSLKQLEEFNSASPVHFILPGSNLISYMSVLFCSLLIYCNFVQRKMDVTWFMGNRFLHLQEIISFNISIFISCLTRTFIQRRPDVVSQAAFIHLNVIFTCFKFTQLHMSK